jgi:hypothetical protein
LVGPKSDEQKRQNDKYLDDKMMIEGEVKYVRYFAVAAVGK